MRTKWWRKFTPPPSTLLDLSIGKAAKHSSLKIGTRLELVREEENKFAQYAALYFLARLS